MGKAPSSIWQKTGKGIWVALFEREPDFGTPTTATTALRTALAIALLQIRYGMYIRWNPSTAGFSDNAVGFAAGITTRIGMYESRMANSDGPVHFLPAQKIILKYRETFQLVFHFLFLNLSRWL